MKYSLIKYESRWDRKMSGMKKSSGSYRGMKGKDNAEYYHLAAVTDDQAVKDLVERGFF